MLQFVSFSRLQSLRHPIAPAKMCWTEEMGYSNPGRESAVSGISVSRPGRGEVDVTANIQDVPQDSDDELQHAVAKQSIDGDAA